MVSVDDNLCVAWMWRVEHQLQEDSQALAHECNAARVVEVEPFVDRALVVFESLITNKGRERLRIVEVDNDTCKE